MSSDAVYSILLYDFVISSANNYKKIGSVELGSVQPVFGITRFGITSGDCSYIIITEVLATEVKKIIQ